MSDPAFLLYSKDWLTGTSEFTHKAKGVYIDLLCYQQQNDGIPNDPKKLARMVGMSGREFTQAWNEIDHKFDLADNGRLYNAKLVKIIAARDEFGKKKTILGIYGAWIKKLDAPASVISEIKKKFKHTEFLEIPDEELQTKVLADLQAMLQAQLEHIGIGNANAIIPLKITEPAQNPELLPSEIQTDDDRAVLYSYLGQCLYHLEELSMDLSGPKVRALFPWWNHLKLTGRHPNMNSIKELIKRTDTAEVSWITQAVSFSISNDYAGVVPFEPPKAQQNGHEKPPTITEMYPKDE